tara:strand:- start:3164 stop:3745 length:582 start_codon:yes stop_codon:yes gene_type:complete
MCVSAAVLAAAALVTAAVGTAATIDNANYQRGMAGLQLAQQRDEMREQRKDIQLQAQEAEAARLEEYRNQREANLLALAGSGTGQNMSWLQGIDPANEKALKHDLANIRLGLAGGENRLAQQIRVNKTQDLIADKTRDAQIFGSVIDFAGQALGTASYYNSYAPGAKVPAGGSPTVTVGGGGGGGGGASRGGF